MALLTTPHERALTLLFSELEATVAVQREAFLGTPGSLDERTNENGTRFWVRRYSDAAGRRLEAYLGMVNDPDTLAKVDALRTQIDGANAVISQVRLLARAGFVTVDRKAYGTLASLHNHGLFRAGALVIGSHAYGALLNALGVKAVSYSTEDVDIARREALALPGVPPFIEMLRATGIDFFEVPRIDHQAPATSFAEPGGSRLRVDLLVPSSNDTYPTIPVPELKAHAKGLPYLAYLLGASQEVPILSPHGAVMVRVPVPERYAIHKLIVSQLREKTSGKPEKDLRQAATLIEALVERFPGAVEDALRAIPKSASRPIKRAREALKRHLPESAEAAWEALE
ncbi:MAG TPA: GSU2403 family nucleotidyltransferase fold protein [Steroidobacteraceae bacterium]|nr:GSU2403 family nucleotidyltransferase fold protein [Steroidobacteraceae bacterium]